jgi:hypothetical protein
MVLSFTICIMAVVLELGVVVHLVRNSLGRRYPSFSIYAIWLLVANSAILVTDLSFRSIYPLVYWHIDSIDIVLRFLVVWEVFHQVFPRNSGLNRSFSKGLGMIGLGLLMLACATFWGYQNYTSLRSIHLALDRSFGFVQALMILGTLVMARYYGLRCGRNVRGIALAFGAWVSISTANNAMADVASSFLPYFNFLRPVSFVVMMAVWVWALWVYEPNPPIMEGESAELTQWAADWNRTISTARTIIRP